MVLFNGFLQLALDHILHQWVNGEGQISSIARWDGARWRDSNWVFLRVKLRLHATIDSLELIIVETLDAADSVAVIIRSTDDLSSKDALGVDATRLVLPLESGRVQRINLRGHFRIKPARQQEPVMIFVGECLEDLLSIFV